MSSVVRRSLIAVVFVAGILTLRILAGSAWNVRSNTLTVQRPLMGTIWKISVADHGRSEAARIAVSKAYDELTRLDALMSEWKPNSPVTQINDAAGERAVIVPAELRELIQRSIRYSEITEGTFDITWRGMGDIWRFDEQFKVPTAEEVARGQRRVSYREIRIDGDRVFLPRTGMKIGLGGIAKGYAIDRAIDVLRTEGFTDALVDGGGDVRVSGSVEGHPWRLGIQEPRQERGRILGTVELGVGSSSTASPNLVLVTSGDYERFRIVDGVRYHHIIDVRTGWPAWASSSVTVLARSTEQGVVLAKGIFILGHVKGLELAESEGVDALVIDAQGKQYMTPGFARCLRMERN